MAEPPPGRCAGTLSDHDARRRVDRMAGQLAGLAAAGIAGVRCMAPAALDGADWRRVIDRGRQARGDLRAIVWTHGVAAHVVAGLEDCGFDAAVASDAWWNLADDWLYQEIARLSRIGSVLACPEVPFGPRLGETAGSAAAAGIAATRALRLAPWLFDGLILQTGFAWGDPDPLRPDAIPRPARSTRPSIWPPPCGWRMPVSIAILSTQRPLKPRPRRPGGRFRC
ncbi:hypothetical protein ACFQ4K_33700 [Tistrella bauzanensis]